MVTIARHMANLSQIWGAFVGAMEQTWAQVALCQAVILALPELVSQFNIREASNSDPCKKDVLRGVDHFVGNLPNKSGLYEARTGHTISADFHGTTTAPLLVFLCVSLFGESREILSKETKKQDNYKPSNPPLVVALPSTRNKGECEPPPESYQDLRGWTVCAHMGHSHDYSRILTLYT